MVNSLTCPRCSQNLLTQRDGDVETDVCPDCKGLWLDAGELESLVQDKDALQKVFNGELVNTQPSALHCPKCGASMKMFKGGLVSPLLIVDQCPKCRGLWLDNGELALVKKLLTVPQP